MTHPHVRHDSFVCATYLIRISFVCVAMKSTQALDLVRICNTRYCNALMQNDNTLLHYTYCSTLLQHTTATHLLQHTSAPYYCTTRMQPHTTATNYYIILPGLYSLAHICNTINWNTPLQQTYCNSLTATDLLQHTTAPRLLHHTNTTPRYGNTLLRHITSALTPSRLFATLTTAIHCCNKLTATHLLQHTTAPHSCTTLLHNAYCTTRMQRHYCNTLLQHITRTLSPCAYLQH